MVSRVRVLVLSLLLSLPGLAAAQVSVFPSFASTAGGTVLRLTISSSRIAVSGTVGGVPVSVLSAINTSSSKSVFVVAPSLGVGPAAVQVIDDLGNSHAGTVTYVDMPAIGAPTGVVRASVSASGAEGTARGPIAGGSSLPTLSATGRYAAFFSDTDLGLALSPIPPASGYWYVKDLDTDAISSILPCEGCQNSVFGWSMTSNLAGTRFAYRYTSPATVVGSSGACCRAAYVDLASGVPVRIDVTPSGTPSPDYWVGTGPVVSGDGGFAVFTSAGTDLDAVETVTGSFDLFVRDLNAGVTQRYTTGITGSDIQSVGISADGRLVASARPRIWTR